MRVLAELSGFPESEGSNVQDIEPLIALGFSPTIAERFNRRLGRVPSGHGAISRGGRGTGIEATHRVAWMLANGPIPAGMYVCHHCDTPACCEPTHLYLGTAATNYADMRRRGRIVALRGEASPRCTISDEQVRQIRADYTGKRGDYTRIARQHGIDITTARAIILGLRRATA